MDDHFPETTKQCKITTGESDLVEPRKGSPCSFSIASLQLLSKYESRMERLNGKNLNNPSHSATSNSTGDHKLSTVEIMKVATASYTSQSSGNLSMFIHPFNCDHSVSSEVAEDVELAQLLLASAEKVSNLQFDRARKLLNMCYHMASPMGNPVQRVVYYFTEALQERVTREKGISSSEGWERNKRWLSHTDEAVTSVRPSTLAYRRELPLYLVTQYAGIQAILESVASAKRIHLVDLGIRSGTHWIILMQALAVRDECPLEILKITAVGTRSKQMIEETGRRLLSFAETLSLAFSFKVVMVSDMKDLNEHLFDLDTSEAVAIHSSLLLMNLIPQPKHLETLIRAIRNLCPIVMVVTEIEVNTNSPALMDRFIEALYFYSAHFDSFDAGMDRCDPNRLTLEANYFQGGIQDVITFDGEQRTTWHMKIDGWRALFKSFGMVETELSMSSLYQANLVLKNYACGSSCTLDMDGKCLLVGWKGTPIFNLSAWKFHSKEAE